MKKILLLLIIPVFVSCNSMNPEGNKSNKKFPENFAYINFTDSLRPWDGFGVNYVETSQSTNYDEYPQDYGGFSTLNETQRQEIIELIFGEDGLKPAIVKMFLDPFHEETAGGINDNDDPYSINKNGFDHERTTQWMRYFVQEGIKKASEYDREIRVITTLYGPPAWMTRQKTFRGRDLDPGQKFELAEYMTAWVKYLKDNDYPVEYLSLHNEGEDYRRWNEDGFTDKPSHDYNLYWPPEQVVDFLEFMPAFMEQHGVTDVELTPGELSTWFRMAVNFRAPEPTSYGAVIASSDKALTNMGLITGHSFWNPESAGTDFLKSRDFRWSDHEELKVWTTSLSWREMNTDFLSYIYDEIYIAKANAVIPWACIQNHKEWTGGDPNPGSAFFVDGEGNYEVTNGYYYFKQLARAGQPGMNVVETFSSHPDIKIIAFANDEGAEEKNAFVVINTSETPIELTIKTEGLPGQSFSHFRTSENEQYKQLGEITGSQHKTIEYQAPANSATTFFSVAP